ncbi:MAG TPA: hypothetical protein VMF12_03155, partial [Xanthobacteraceae bacterium]|nr:hypothetical protein [Xanthobacteraceae bacterium]
MGQTLVDFADLLAATALLAVLLILPGAAIGGWIGGLGAKGDVSKEVRPDCGWGTALLFSLTVLPVLLSLVARLANLDAAVAVQLILVAAGVLAARKMERPPLRSVLWCVLGLLACSLIIGLATIDIRF